MVARIGMGMDERRDWKGCLEEYRGFGGDLEVDREGKKRIKDDF